MLTELEDGSELGLIRQIKPVFERKELYGMLIALMIQLINKMRVLESSLKRNQVDRSTVRTLDRFDFQLIFPFLDVRNQCVDQLAQLIHRLAELLNGVHHVMRDVEGRNSKRNSLLGVRTRNFEEMLVVKN